MAIQPDLLIPPDSELGQLLLQLSDDTDDKTWQIANLTNEIVEELEGGIVTKSEIYRAISARCKGRKPNTIRRWAEVAKDYPRKIQKKYMNLLSFDHFKVSRRLFMDGYTPSLEYGLEWCLKSNDHKLNAGKFRTVGELLYHFLPPREMNPRVIWRRVSQSLYDHFLLIDNDTDRNRLLEAWKEIEYVLDREKVL